MTDTMNLTTASMNDFLLTDVWRDCVATSSFRTFQQKYRTLRGCLSPTSSCTEPDLCYDLGLYLWLTSKHDKKSSPSPIKLPYLYSDTNILDFIYVSDLTYT